MASCLVIGGNGFLGSYVVDALVALGHEVSVFDRFSASVMFASRDVRRITGDFLNHADVRSAVSGQDYVFHFLSTTTPASAEDDPSLDVRTNIAASIDLFDFAVQAGTRRLIFASTGGAIYGDQPTGAITEDALPRPVSPYAIGKQTIEGYLRYYHRKHGLESTSFRISNPYGPRQRANKKQGVIPIFLQHIAHGTPITVYGDGSMTRDFLYAADAATLVARTIATTPKHSVYNIGSGHGTTINEVLDLARSVTGREVEVLHQAPPRTFIERSVLDVNRYTEEFGPLGSLALREGVELTWHDTLEQLA